MIELSFKRAIRFYKTYIELWQTQNKPFPQQSVGLKSRSCFEQQTMPTFLQLPTIEFSIHSLLNSLNMEVLAVWYEYL